MEKLLMDVPEYLVHPCPNRSFPGRQPPRQRLLDYPYTHTTPTPLRGLHPGPPRMMALDMRRGARWSIY